MAIHSDAEFLAVFGGACRKAIEATLEKTYEELKKAMKADIYGAYSPNDYARTEELLEAWRQQTFGVDGTFGMRIEHEPGMLVQSPILWRHASGMVGTDWFGVSIADRLLEKIEAGYKGYHAKKGRDIPARPFWDKFVINIKDDIGKWFGEFLAAIVGGGCTVKKVG